MQIGDFIFAGLLIQRLHPVYPSGEGGLVPNLRAKRRQESVDP
jgi:hypothetical protein